MNTSNYQTETIQEKGGKRLQRIKGKVLDAIKETHDTWSLIISVSENEKNYKAGQFLNIDPHQFPEVSEVISYLESKKKTKELPRAYSIASYPNEKNIKITIKKEIYYEEESDFPPLLSPILASPTLIGRDIEFQGYVGAYTLKEDHASYTNEVLHLVSGSGVVPSYSIIKDELINNKNTDVKHKFLNVNKKYDDIIYVKELNELSKKYPERLKLLNFITREKNITKYGDNFFEGRPSEDAIKKNIDNIDTVLVFACGASVTKWQKINAKKKGEEASPKFLNTISDIIEKIGIDKKRFKKEGW